MSLTGLSGGNTGRTQYNRLSHPQEKPRKYLKQWDEKASVHFRRRSFALTYSSLLPSLCSAHGPRLVFRTQGGVCRASWRAEQNLLCSQVLGRMVWWSSHLLVPEDADAAQDSSKGAGHERNPGKRTREGQRMEGERGLKKREWGHTGTGLLANRAETNLRALLC